MKHRNGWGNVRGVISGIRWWKRRLLRQETRHVFQTSSTSAMTKPERITQIKSQKEPRLPTSMPEFNRVLGGGIVAGSLVLIGGDPGIGKSTLLLQVSAQIAKKDFPVLYISGEESSRQTKLRAERLGVMSDELYVLPETNLQDVLNQIDQIEPKFVVIDSIQTIFKEDITSAPGSVAQVRECTSHLMRIAKTKGIPIFIVGHVTKEGSIAGPRLLEHMVDAVLYFEESGTTLSVFSAVLKTASEVHMKWVSLR